MKRPSVLRPVGVLRRTFAALLFACALALPASSTHAADPIAGAYHGSVVLGPVLLDGVYPLVVGRSHPASIDVSTSATGVLAARVTLAGMSEDASGRIVVRSHSIRLALRSKLAVGRLSLTAKLQGSAFVGMLKFRGAKQTCRIQVGAVGPIRAQYQLTLASTAKGAVTGTGTLTVARQDFPVSVRGNVRKERASLRLKAGRTLLTITKGDVVAGSIFSQKWTAQGFGALIKGKRRLTLDPG